MSLRIPLLWLLLVTASSALAQEDTPAPTGTRGGESGPSAEASQDEAVDHVAQEHLEVEHVEAPSGAPGGTPVAGEAPPAPLGAAQDLAAPEGGDPAGDVTGADAKVWSEDAPVGGEHRATGGFVGLIRDLALPMAAGLGLGLLVGLVGPLARRRKVWRPDVAPRGVVHWPEGMALPPPGEARCWQVPDEAVRTQLLCGAARHAAQQGPVLLAPRAASRPALAGDLAGLPPVLVPVGDCAAPAALAAGASRLGEGLLLVGGPGALESPKAGESEQDPLDELLELSPLPVVLIVLPHEVSPVPERLVFTATPEGLCLRGRVVFAGARFVTATP